MTAPSTASRFRAAVDQAMTLDPAEIADTIISLSIPMPTGGEVHVSGGGISNPTEQSAIGPTIEWEKRVDRWLEACRHADAAGRKRPPPPPAPDPAAELRDIAKLDRAVTKWRYAVQEVSERVWDTIELETWEEAVHHGNILCGSGLVEAAELDGVRFAGAVDRAEDAARTVQRIHDGHCPHPPDEDTQLHAEEICLSHARIGIYDRGRHGDLCICKTCRDLIARIATPPEVHRDPDWWPPESLLREDEHRKLTGARTDYQRALTAWVNTIRPDRRAS